MATKQKAMNTYRPRLELGDTVEEDELAEYLVRNTNLSRGMLIQVLLELHTALIYFGSQGRGVKIKGLGTFLPSIKLNGQLDMSCRLDRDIRRYLNATKFRGKIINKHNIGKTVEMLITQWNNNFPDDLVKH